MHRTAWPAYTLVMPFKSPAIHRTPLYRAKAAYLLMRRRCGVLRAYRHVELRMTLEQWLGWSLPRYAAFLAEHPDESPNVSRHGDIGHYEIGNIDIVTQAENRRAQKALCRVAADGFKRCTRCSERKVAAAFNKKRSATDGLQYWCRACFRAPPDGPVTRAAMGPDS